MSRSSPLQSILRSAGLPTVAIIAMGFFAYNAVLGPNGVMQLKDIKAEVAQKNVEYAALEKRRAVVQNHVDLLDPKRGADPDMVDELARKQLNVARPDEVVVVLKKK
jgi:cell division protein FtsB